MKKILALILSLTLASNACASTIVDAWLENCSSYKQAEKTIKSAKEYIDRLYLQNPQALIKIYQKLDEKEHKIEKINAGSKEDAQVAQATSLIVGASAIALLGYGIYDFGYQVGFEAAKQLTNEYYWNSRKDDVLMTSILSNALLAPFAALFYISGWQQENAALQKELQLKAVKSIKEYIAAKQNNLS